MTNISQMLTPRELADRLKISYEKALEIIRYSGLKYTKIGRQYRVSEADLVAFLKSTSAL